MQRITRSMSTTEDQNKMDKDIKKLLQDMETRLKGTIEKSIDGAVDKIKVEITGLRNELADVKTTVGDLTTSLEHTQKDCDDLKTNIKNVEERFTSIETKTTKDSLDLQVLKLEKEEIKEQLLHMDSYSRRDNLLFSGIADNRDERDYMAKRKLLDIMKNNMGLQDVDQFKIVRCHRLGPFRYGRMRDIIIRFHYFGDRSLVWDSRAKLRGTNVYLKEDFPLEVLKRRASLWPVMKAAQRKNYNASLVEDKLMIDGRRYTVDDLDSLPENIQPISMKFSNNFLCFYGRFCIYSNFHKAKFRIDNLWYNCVEQYLQSQKAEFYGNEILAHRIRITEDPRQQKAMADKLRGREADWLKAAEQVMERGIYEKFAQNQVLGNKMKEEKGLFVECNRNDSTWGIGLSLEDYNISNSDMWKGQNLLGQILDKVQSRIRRLLT